MDQLNIEQLKEELSRFVKVKQQCESLVEDHLPSDPNALMDNIEEIKTIMHNIVRIYFLSHGLDEIPEEVTDLFNIKFASKSDISAESNIDETVDSDVDYIQMDEDDIKIQQRLQKLSDAAEKQRLEQSLLPAKPPRPKRIVYNAKDKDKFSDNFFDSKDLIYAEKWILSQLDTPRNRYLAEHRAKHGEDALIEYDPKDMDDHQLKEIEYNPDIGDTCPSVESTKRLVARKPHLRSEERADIYTFYLRFSQKYFKSWIYSFVTKKYGISQHAFRHIIKEVEKKKSFEKGTPTGRSRKLSPEQEEEMINFMKTEVGSGRILTTKDIASRYGITRSMAHGYMVRHNIMRLSSKTKRILRLQAEGKEYTPWPAKYNKRKQERKKALKAGLVPLEPEGRAKKVKTIQRAPSENSNQDLMIQTEEMDQIPLNMQQTGVVSLSRADLLQSLEPEMQLSYNPVNGQLTQIGNPSLSSLSAISNVNKSMANVFPGFYSPSTNQVVQSTMAWATPMDVNTISNYSGLVTAQFPSQRDLIIHQHQQQYRPN